MILADKIIQLRKKAGWSQEELAQQLNVTRQSVSKWEGAQSIPDVDKILQMSRLFGVSTDYLLKDDMESLEPAQSEPDTSLRVVTMEEASEYLELRRRAAPRMALATFLCVISPIALILLAAAADSGALPISDAAACGVGLCTLMLLVAAGVVLFMLCGSRTQKYGFMENEPFETSYGVEGMVKERREKFRSTGTKLNILGTVLCILSIVPLFAALAEDAGDFTFVEAVCLLMFLVALGCIAFVYGGTCRNAMDRLLEEGDYSRSKKAEKSISGTVSLIYWLVATAVFLICTFGPTGNRQPQSYWIIWAVAGVLYGAVMAVMRLVKGSGK